MFASVADLDLPRRDTFKTGAASLTKPKNTADAVLVALAADTSRACDFFALAEKNLTKNTNLLRQGTFGPSI